MRTYFASAERTNASKLKEEISTVSQNPVMEGLLKTVAGLLAVVDQNRQIVAANDALLQLLGIQDPFEALGLRPGEVLKCPHSCREPGGCGTSELCRTCGTVIAMVSSMEMDAPVEKTCNLTATIQGNPVDLVLKVRSHPLEIAKERFLLLFLQDITDLENKAAMERIFYHDINNVLCSLLGTAELLSYKYPQDEHIKIIHQIAHMLPKEIEIQRYIALSHTNQYSPRMETVTTHQLHNLTINFFANHPAAQKKTLRCYLNLIDIPFQTDVSVLQRILFNMVTNALEATTPDKPVIIWAEATQSNIVFCVQNPQVIPEEIALRIFEHHFSTKPGSGRGTGTFSMKLLGEKILGGKVSFTTTEKKGTIFRLALPIG
jgi:K+-sensing histidine kinase KdpD